MKYTYLLVNFFSILIPFLFSFHPTLHFYKNFKAVFLSSSIVGVLFIAWDIVFTNIGVWGFNPTYVTGIYFFNLPIEEILFFYCIPFSCVFTYHCLTLFFKLQWSPKTESIFVLPLSSILLVIGLYFYSKWYTSSTFISLAIVLLILKYIVKIQWLGKFVFIYIVILIPFFIVNGVLTGSGLEHPVVWYNDSENLGIRLFTIPIEDVFYGFELILLNIYFYTIFLSQPHQVLKKK